ncbi:MAG: endoglucanase [Acetobacteraceae bacterium]|nr:endoglucanase [Acetobacteraceae bacterium]
MGSQFASTGSRSPGSLNRALQPKTLEHDGFELKGSCFRRKILAHACRASIAFLASLSASLPVRSKAAEDSSWAIRDKSEWQAFVARFVTPDGRVVDTGNGGVSHSESQGWGMFFAVVYNDPETFDRISAWTTRTLQREKDSLHSWRYVPGSNPPVADKNNATDGDLFIALALARASVRWGRPDHARAAADIAHDVLRILVGKVAGLTILLPGATGFIGKENVVVNPSYYVFPALPELAKLAPSPAWEKIRADGLELITRGRFGRWKLPPDWLAISRKDGSLAPAPNWPPRFSFDAIRVPLYLAWAQQLLPPVKEAFTDFWSSSPRIPAWVDLLTNEVAPYPGPPGFDAVAQLAQRDVQASPSGMHFPSVGSAPDYYSAALTLLARIAWAESGPPT